MDTKAFTSFLHSNIPLTEFMDIQAETYTPEKVVLSVPFAQNKNDKNTGFAGSISALMTVCGWSVMYTNFHELLPKGNIVAQKTQIRYIAPITGDFPDGMRPGSAPLQGRQTGFAGFFRKIPKRQTGTPYPVFLRGFTDGGNGSHLLYHKINTKKHETSFQKFRALLFQIYQNFSQYCFTLPSSSTSI